MWAAAEPLPTREQLDAALRGRIGPALWQRFQGAKVAVCGLGGLGSHIAVAPARAGVGALSLIDFDKVDLSNLNRQQYKASQIGGEKPLALAENLREINPYLGLECHTLRLTPENIPAGNAIRTEKVGKRLYLCGDGQSDVEEAGSLFAPRVMLCAGHQALAVLRVLAGELDV